MFVTRLSEQHAFCDELFCKFEEMVEQLKWDEAEKTFDEFRQKTRTHLDFEENTLFPAFEQATGMSRAHGPTGVMCAEHEQIRSYIEEIRTALLERDKERVLSLGDTLMITIGQHNMKEEQVLYPMCERHLDPDILNQQ